MAILEELPDDCGACNSGCGKIATNKCLGCKEVFYCGKVCQKKHWKVHRPVCKTLAYKICNNKEVGNYLAASRDIKAGEVIFTDTPLVVGPATVTSPVCLACYTPVDGSYKCPKSGWPLCGPSCSKKVEHNPEVVIPAQCEATFEIDDYSEPCYLYECLLVLRALLLQKSAPQKYKAMLQMQSHIEDIKGTKVWDVVQERIIDVMKKTLGIMVFEAVCPEYDFSDETIQKIVGILDTNKKEIRLAYSDVEALYPISCLMEHNCQPNVKINYSKNFKITVTAGRNIREGEHLAIMYTHALWGSMARRDHLNIYKRFWCTCKRCGDPTEFGTNFSTIFDNGHPMYPEDPLNAESDWVCKETGLRKSAYDVKMELSELGKEIEILMEKGGIDDFEEFLEAKKKKLHKNHYHMVTVKHQLLQMYGRTEGHLIQDMTEEQLERKIELCNENLELLKKLDPDMIRLEIYAAASHYELHLPLLQISKRKWETGKLSTEEFRTALEEPHKCITTAIELLQKEVNDMLPEGQLLLQAKDTLEQLEGFMKTVGCQI